MRKNFILFVLIIFFSCHRTDTHTHVDFAFARIQRLNDQLYYQYFDKGSYPEISTAEFIKNYESDIPIYRDIRYSSTKSSYTLTIILDINYPFQKYSVVIISPKSVYWMDDIANPNDSIDDINIPKDLNISSSIVCKEGLCSYTPLCLKKRNICTNFRQ